MDDESIGSRSHPNQAPLRSFTPPLLSCRLLAHFVLLIEHLGRLSRSMKIIVQQMTLFYWPRLRTAVKLRKDETERERISLYYDSKNIRQ